MVETIGKEVKKEREEKMKRLNEGKEEEKGMKQ